MVQPTVSVVIPTYNRAHLIKDSVESIINQSYDNWELIIVDDGSKDNTKEILKTYAHDGRIMYVERPETYPKGANACRNYGFELAKGDYIKWLDSDDLLVENCLRVQLDNIERNNSEVDIGQSEFFNPEGGRVRYDVKRWGELYNSDNLADDLIFGKNRWSTPAGLWSKKVLPKKPFNEKIQNSQEWLFHIEMVVMMSIKISFSEKSLVLVRDQSGSMSHSENQGGKYFYYSALARYLAISKLYSIGHNKSARKYLFKKFVRLHLFTLYKGFLKGFLKNSVRVPILIFKTII